MRVRLCYSSQKESVQETTLFSLNRFREAKCPECFVLLLKADPHT